MKVLKAFESLVGAIVVLFMVWFVLSWLNIGFNNHVANPVYHPMNLFLISKGWGV